MPENDTKLNLYYDKNNSSKVTEIIYECRLNDQICCGLECCANPAITTAKREEKSGMSWLIAILCIALIGGVGCCVYSQVKKSAVRNENGYNDGQASYTVYPAQQQPQYQQQQAAYPTTNQGWDGAAPAYPQQPGFYGGEQQPPSYPAATHTPQSYPPGPPVQNYGFNAQSYPKYP